MATAVSDCFVSLYRRKLRSYIPPPFPIASDVVRLILSFLNERQRLRFLVTSKTLAPWLHQRREAANCAFEQLKEQKKLWIRTKRLHPRCTHYFDHSISFSPEYAGLLLVRTSWHTTMWNGITYHHDFRYRHFAPWARAFVCAETPKENSLCEAEADTVVDDDHETWYTLCAVSRRAF